MPSSIRNSDEAVRIAEAALRDHLSKLAGPDRRALVRAVATSLEEQVRVERELCVGVCRRRAGLWRVTTAARRGMAPAREEARARANEADYLADLLDSGEDLAVARDAGEPDA